MPSPYQNDPDLNSPINPVQFDRSVTPGASQPQTNQPFQPSTPPPVPDPRKRDHAMPGSQHTVDPSTLPLAAQNLFNANTPVQNQPQLTNTEEAPAPPPPTNPNDPFNFIMGSEAPKQKTSLMPSLPGSNSLMGRVIVIGGGLILLIVAFSIIKGVLGGNGANLTSLITVLQDEQAIESVTNNASQNQDITTNNDNYAETANAALTSSMTNLETFLKAAGYKVSATQLNLKVSTEVNSELTSAEADGTYNQTFDQVNQTLLNGYMNDLKTAYRLTPGPKGRALLTSDFNQAQLMLNQLT